MTQANDAALPLRDTALRYGKITRALHWGLGLLILWQLFGMIVKVTLEKSPTVSAIVSSHQPVGLVIFALVVVRILWALMNRSNRPAHGSGLVGLASRAGHAALYALMALIPFTALIRSWGNQRVFAPFGFEIFPAQEPPVAWAVNVAEWHGEMGWLMLVLILGHIAMVAVHDLAWKDNILRRMAGR
ncbi:cytochrome b [Falsigemmobacter faecalis]|uniref:Cytochrome b n=1 Tax=Falsigemmobacter faecalis TaxID=2488730 RepID=A0A3P3DVV2_9RHOB|nr:cytochrome b [Falsigemmobacter faecalis]RRH78124.1 cytochrome b [Falsigemmobacter faecalis]